jgi:hypothetical protein
MKMDQAGLVVIAGGNVGSTVTNALTGYVSGVAGLTGPTRSAVNVLLRVGVGLVAIAGSEKLKSSGGAGNAGSAFTEGFGTSATYGILDEVLRGAGYDPYTGTYVQGARTRAGVMAKKGTQQRAPASQYMAPTAAGAPAAAVRTVGVIA